ncbi:MAG: glycosyltransferase [Pseudomonadota bacterium]|nr:glycosyltransferase [Pseudomonadota bacterium]
MPRLLQLVHGYPPRQSAGTEQYARRVADGLRARGWDVHTVAAAPDAGAAPYAITEGPGLTRVANNTPYAGLRRGASDPAFDRIVTDLAARFRPDVVHVQHLAFLSASFSVEAPVVWTLHDAWGWCPAGGLLLRDGQPCDGPGAACVPCASEWARDTPALTRAVGLAGRASRYVAPARLQGMWRRLPGGLRARMLAGSTPPLTAGQLADRDRTIRAFAARCAALVSPSRWLAAAAVAQGLPAPRVIPHGVDPVACRDPRAADGPFLFLGTLASHKGPHLVREAWRASGVDVPLRVHGPPGPDAAYVAGLPNDGALDAAVIPAQLARARALVLGSIWPENAPLVVLEARAAGCPVIAPDIGGLSELVEPGVDGWLYPPGNVPALAAALRAAAITTLPVRPPPTFAAHLDQLVALYATTHGSASGRPPVGRNGV